jgi:16S rRNA processing protein RimM
MGETRVCLGVITGAHGVRGLVRVKPFTEVPEDVAAYGPLSDEDGARAFTLTLIGHSKGALLARVEGVVDRDQAQALKGTRLYVPRDVLPALHEEQTYYHADLLGLAVEDREGRSLGRVAGVHNFGAGDILELDGKDRRLVPFTRRAVPFVDLEGGRLVVDLPEEVE